MKQIDADPIKRRCMHFGLTPDGTIIPESNTSKKEILKFVAWLQRYISGELVETQVYGTWIYIGVNLYSEFIFQCSECKEQVYTGCTTRFCPNCGARMVVNNG